MANLRRAYTDGRFGQIRYQVGTPEGVPIGRPLYCLHQSPKSSIEFETFLATASGAPFNRVCIGLDYPGYGMSDAPPSEKDASVEAYAEAAWTVADALGHDSIDVFGNHTGAKVAVEMARLRPSRVGTIAMVSAAILTDEERAQYEDYFTPIPLDRDGTRIKENWRRIVDTAGAGWSLEQMDRSILQTCMGGEAYEWGHSAAFAYAAPFEEGLAQLPHRKILLNPADTLCEVTRRAEGIMTNGELIECPDWGYGFLDVHPVDVAELLLPRLDGTA